MDNRTEIALRILESLIQSRVPISFERATSYPNLAVLLTDELLTELRRDTKTSTPSSS
jgi:hypothetical protein